jgi:rhomboid protease GluP
MRQSQADERASFFELHRRLRSLTPYAFGTGAIVAANVAVFALMVASGVHALSPTSQSLIQWGANYGPKVSAGQWWRLFTAMFVHVGVVHIAMNMWGLWNIGRFVERALGTMIYLVVYVLSGWAGSVVSVFMKPMTVSAGASGAIFGVFGVMLAFVLRPRRSVPVAALRSLRGSVFSFLAINLWLGIKIPSIDLAAHGGGLVCGFLLGAVLSHELTPEARRAANRRTVLLGAAVAVALGVATWTLRGRVPDFEAMLKQFGTVEHQVLVTYNDARQKTLDRELSNQEFADVIERDVLPPWRRIRIDPAVYRNAPRKFQELTRDLEDYREAREQGWQLTANGLRTGDTEALEQASDKLRQADAMVKAMGKHPK